MILRVAVYNMEWMRDLFHPDGTPITTGKDGKRSRSLAAIIKALQVDFLGVVEGPDTLVSGAKTSSGQLLAWANEFIPGHTFSAVHGFPSSGQQELGALFDHTKIKVLFTPETRDGERFNEPFLMDTTNRMIKEQYKHYRPPLELSILGLDDQLFSRVIIAHTKSKGIFDKVDYARFEQLSQRDRLRLFGECMHIRERCNQYLAKGQNVIVMGDINDGFELDFYENRFSKSAVELLLGDTWKPEWILRSVLPKPKLTAYGWTPYSGKYVDRITGDEFNVLIDHILVSRGIRILRGQVWNPSLEQDDPLIQGLRNELFHAADHFPIFAELET
ncbi:endonuclease/exonuclease/phosphatase family protein [Algoriphagus terrigena]|uniref:endonuclease/exonuclease/phosphatase family protein n=1 Tax=Algoriphagus terrigena TaxID=344884 RepID=UPI0004144785|nr:hypothetical protein [Algoriphagus terrigena]